jgi:hypothetical protein
MLVPFKSNLCTRYSRLGYVALPRRSKDQKQNHLKHAFLFITNLLIHEALNKNLEQQDGNLTHLNQQHEKR